MKLSDEWLSLAKNLASQMWTWDRKSVETTLSELGLRKCESRGHRDTYTSASGHRGSVYHDGADPELIEFTVAAFTEADSLDAPEYEDKTDEFYLGFINGTKQISGVLGQPAFSDGGAASGFPDDQDAVWLSLWNLPSARLMLQQKHEDRELPFRICIVIAPPLQSR